MVSQDRLRKRSDREGERFEPVLQITVFRNLDGNLEGIGARAQVIVAVFLGLDGRIQIEFKQLTERLFHRITQWIAQSGLHDRDFRIQAAQVILFVDTAHGGDQQHGADDKSSG